MKTRILITAATEKEISAINTNEYADRVDVDLLVTGVGQVLTVYSLMKYLSNNNTLDYILNIGIAGSFTSKHAIGDTMIVAEDYFADLGIEEQYELKSAWDAGLISAHEFPFESGAIVCDPGIIKLLGLDIKAVRGITINTVSGTEKTIQSYIEKFNPDIETMEVAAALYVGRMENIPLIPLRSISNLIEPRNRGAWDINKALAALQPAMQIIFEKILK